MGYGPHEGHLMETHIHIASFSVGGNPKVYILFSSGLNISPPHDNTNYLMLCSNML